MMPNLQTCCSLSGLSRIRTGGVASFFASVTNMSELKAVIRFFQNRDIPFYVLGLGSNVVIDDETFDGVVIRLTGSFERIDFNMGEGYVAAGGGTSLMKLGFTLAENGYTDCRYMAVIPGTVGGAVRINAGTTKDGEIRDHFLRAEVFDSDSCEVVTHHLDDMDFKYRRSSISQTRRIVLRAVFSVHNEERINPKLSVAKARALLKSRRAKQPKNPRTFGSTFKNPPGEKTAGWYLEQVGMKGVRVGGGMVANEHANWIVNTGKATSSDVKKLIQIGSRRVFEHFGLFLEREVVFLPEDMRAWT